MSRRLENHLSTLKELQTTESNLYDVLTANAQRVASGSPQQLTDQEINTIVKQIQTLSSSRTSLYNELDQLYKEQTGYSKEANDALSQQTMSLQLFEKDLNKTKQALTKLEDEKYNELKMVEINTYYTKKYQDQNSLMKWIVIIGVVVIVCNLLRRVIGEAAGYLSSLVIIIGGTFLLYKMYDMFTRRGDIYDEYQWQFTPNEKNTQYITDEPIFDIKGDIPMPFFCMDGSCCTGGTMYKEGEGCVPAGKSNISQGV